MDKAIRGDFLSKLRFQNSYAVKAAEHSKPFPIVQKIAKLSKNFYLNHKISFKKRQKDNNIRPVPADRPRHPSDFSLRPDLARSRRKLYFQ